MCYNDPQFADAWTVKQWFIVTGILLVFVLTQTLIAWKAFLHNPNGEEPELPGVPPVGEPTKPASIGTEATGTTPTP